MSDISKDYLTLVKKINSIVFMNEEVERLLYETVDSYTKEYGDIPEYLVISEDLDVLEDPRHAGHWMTIRLVRSKDLNIKQIICGRLYDYRGNS